MLLTPYQGSRSRHDCPVCNLLRSLFGIWGYVAGKLLLKQVMVGNALRSYIRPCWSGVRLCCVLFCNTYFGSICCCRIQGKQIRSTPDAFPRKKATGYLVKVFWRYFMINVITHRTAGQLICNMLVLLCLPPYNVLYKLVMVCLLYTSPSPRD